MSDVKVGDKVLHISDIGGQCIPIARTVTRIETVPAYGYDSILVKDGYWLDDLEGYLDRENFFSLQQVMDWFDISFDPKYGGFTLGILFYLHKEIKEAREEVAEMARTDHPEGAKSEGYLEALEVVRDYLAKVYNQLWPELELPEEP